MAGLSFFDLGWAAALESARAKLRGEDVSSQPAVSSRIRLPGALGCKVYRLLFRVFLYKIISLPDKAICVLRRVAMQAQARRTARNGQPGPVGIRKPK
ncbi:MAG: hypothetical protein ACP5DC_01455 [Halothiobacillaceae bacterium]